VTAAVRGANALHHPLPALSSCLHLARGTPFPHTPLVHCPFFSLTNSHPAAVCLCLQHASCVRSFFSSHISEGRPPLQFSTSTLCCARANAVCSSDLLIATARIPTFVQLDCLRKAPTILLWCLLRVLLSVADPPPNAHAGCLAALPPSPPAPRHARCATQDGLTQAQRLPEAVQSRRDHTRVRRPKGGKRGANEGTQGGRMHVQRARTQRGAFRRGECGRRTPPVCH
jgi:hypothetical protein